MKVINDYNLFACLASEFGCAHGRLNMTTPSVRLCTVAVRMLEAVLCKFYLLALLFHFTDTPLLRRMSLSSLAVRHKGLFFTSLFLLCAPTFPPLPPSPAAAGVSLPPRSLSPRRRPPSCIPIPASRCLDATRPKLPGPPQCMKANKEHLATPVYMCSIHFSREDKGDVCNTRICGVYIMFAGARGQVREPGV